MNGEAKKQKSPWKPKLINLQVYLPISASNVPIIINHNMCVIQVFIIRSFFLEASKWQPNAGISVRHDRRNVNYRNKKIFIEPISSSWRKIKTKKKKKKEAIHWQLRYHFKNWNAKQEWRIKQWSRTREKWIAQCTLKNKQKTRKSKRFEQETCARYKISKLREEELG